MTTNPPTVESDWTRLGILLSGVSSPSTPDVERVLISTSRAVAQNARLFPLVVTWLAHFGRYVARHRLARLVSSNADGVDAAALGLILESAIELGAPKSLSLVVKTCQPDPAARPLSAVWTELGLDRLAEDGASALSRKWGRWAPATELKPNAIRPASWVVVTNPLLVGRAARKGDLRCSIIETLRHDTGGAVASESELARLTGVTRAAVRKALRDLVREGEILPLDPVGTVRGHGFRLRRAA